MSTSLPFAVFLIASFVIVAVFLHVALSTRVQHDVDYTKANRLRRVFFLSFTTMLVVFLVLTLPRMPYPVEASTPDRVVHVVSKQYQFSLTEGPGPTLESWDRDFSPDVRVPVGSMVEFRVTTLDANHGFSLYTPDGRLLTQTQAMPGYVNRLRARLDQRGTYTVLCLEFCGMGHHRMRGTVEVN